MVGTPYWMAPEVVNLATADDATGDGRRDGYGTKADVWSFGIVACEVLSQGGMPWPSFTTYWEVLVHIAEHDPVLPEHVSPPCKEFLKWVLAREPKKRPTAREVVDHPWLKETDPDIAWATEMKKAWMIQRKRSSDTVETVSHDSNSDADPNQGFPCNFDDGDERESEHNFYEGGVYFADRSPPTNDLDFDPADTCRGR